MMRNLVTLVSLLLSIFNIEALSSTSTEKNFQWNSNDIRTKKPLLNKKSTTLDVLKELNNKNCLANYVGKENCVAVLTGGGSGIGLITAEALSLTGMQVVLCARDVKAAEEAIDTFTQKENIRIQNLDLSDLSNIETACQEITETEGELDILINNAGVMAIPEREETKQGFEAQLGVNHIGHYMFTRLLLPHMNGNGRVVTVASTAHQGGDIDKNDLNYNERKYTPWGAYSQSKLANILFAKGLQDKLSNDILSLCLHPGVIKSPLWRNTPKVLQFASGFFADKTLEQGAATNVYASLMEAGVFESGQYLSDCKVATPTKKAEDVELRDWLWSETEKMIVDQGFVLPEV